MNRILIIIIIIFIITISCYYLIDDNSENKLIIDKGFELFGNEFIKNPAIFYRKTFILCNSI